MSIITIILFLIYTYGLGFSVTLFFKNSDNFFERNLIRIGIGLGIIPFLLTLLNFLHLPVDWKLVLIVSLIVPVFAFVRSLKNGLKVPSVKFSKLNLYILIVLLIFSLTLFMYVKGAFIYPYLEDDDAWAHVTGIKYISLEKKIDDPNNTFLYIKPYPAGYDSFMAILHQTSPSLMWTIKFFNSLIISLGIIFFYFFTKNFMHSSKKALAATTILAMIPCYLSHFIWAHSLVMTLFIVSLYCFFMIENDKKWVYPTMLVIASICLTQPSQAIKYFIIFIIFLIVKWFFSRKFPVYHLTSVIGGYLLSLVWWAFNYKEQFERRLGALTDASLGQGSWLSNIMERLSHISTRGTADRAYTFSDFFIAKSQNMINNPVGIGLVICLLVLFSIFLIFFLYKSMKKEERIWIISTLLWLIFAFIGVNSLTFNLPIHLWAFRFWMLLALPVSIIAAEGFWFLVKFFRQFRVPKIATIALLVILIFLTSGKQKYDVNTAIWGPGQMWTSMDEVQAYVWLKNLPPDTKVFAYSSDEQVIGFDKYSCLWCDNVIEFREGLLEKNISDVYTWLKRNRYEYLMVDGMTYRSFGSLLGENRTNELVPQRLEEINSFGKFEVVYQTGGGVIFRIN